MGDKPDLSAIERRCVFNRSEGACNISLGLDEAEALLAHVRALEADRAALKKLVHELRDSTGGGGLSWSYWEDHNPEHKFASRDAWLSKFRADEDAHYAEFQAETEKLIQDTIEQARAALEAK